ncbi:hypothetical protein BMB171_C0306 [Bacillus thuringiensis BMB171]|nr:hypothetical protein BMB171_C0306 [Bacillus thuringiensis BMB171]
MIIIDCVIHKNRNLLFESNSRFRKRDCFPIFFHSCCFNLELTAFSFKFFYVKRNCKLFLLFFRRKRFSTFLSISCAPNFILYFI